MTRTVEGSYESATASRSLKVLAYPLFDILTPISYTLEQYRDRDIAVSANIKNTGAIAVELLVQLIDRDNNNLVDMKTVPSVAAGASYGYAAAKLMPNKDWNLRLESRHLEYDPFTYEYVWVRDDYVDFTITLLVPVATTLTLSAISDVWPQQPYTYSGRLTRTAVGTGIPGMTINCERKEGANWITVASVSTDANGNYSKSVGAPTAPGTYDVRTSFPGYLALALAASISNQVRIRSGLAADVVTPAVAAIAAGGLTYLLTKKPLASLLLAGGTGIAAYIFLNPPS